MKKELYDTNDLTSLEIAKSALSLAGFDFHVDGEKSLYTGNVELMGGSGATVWVAEEDYIEARRVLLENELITQIKPPDAEFSSVVAARKWFDERFLFGYSFRTKVLSVVILLCLPVLFFAYRLSFKPLSSFSEHANWCVDYVEVDGQLMMPETTSTIKLDMGRRFQRCHERIRFFRDQISLPGFKGKSNIGKYVLNFDSNELLVDLDANSLNQFYDGAYAIKYNKINRRGVLKNDKVSIHFQIEGN